MRKLSEYRDEDALDLLADIMEPASVIIADPDVQKAFEKENKIKAASVAIKRHKRAVMEVLARLDGVAVEDYHCNIFTLPARLIEVLNDDQLIKFFTEQAQTVTTAASSGPATENIVEIAAGKE